MHVTPDRAIAEATKSILDAWLAAQLPEQFSFPELALSGVHSLEELRAAGHGGVVQKGPEGPRAM